MWLIKAWLVRRGWWWSRCPSCKKFSNHIHAERFGRNVHICCTRCYPIVRDWYDGE